MYLENLVLKYTVPYQDTSVHLTTFEFRIIEAFRVEWRNLMPRFDLYILLPSGIEPTNVAIIVGRPVPRWPHEEKYPSDIFYLQI